MSRRQSNTKIVARQSTKIGIATASVVRNQSQRLRGTLADFTYDIFAVPNWHGVENPKLR